MTQDITEHKMSGLRHSLNRFSHNIKEVSTHSAHKVKWWHMLAITLMFALVLCSMIFLVQIDSNKCTIDQAELDTCAKQLTFFSTGRMHFPSTNYQLDLYCKQKMASIKCLKRYVHSCLTVDRVQKNYVKKFVSSYRQQLDHTCLRRAEREKFLTYSTCLSNEALIANATECTVAHHNRLRYIAQYVQDELRIAAGCCSLHMRHSCLSSLMSDDCPATARQFVMDQTEGPYRSLISSVCAPYYLSVKSCANRIDPEVWRDMRLASMPHTPLHTNDTEHRKAVQGGDSLKAKIDQLKFQEGFLALIFIVRHE